MKPLLKLIKSFSIGVGIPGMIYCLSLPLYAQKAGEIDSTFGNNGLILCETNFNPALTPISLMDDQDRILTAATDGNESNVILVRNLPNGSVDPSFGANGQVIYPVTRIYISSMMIQEDGKILVLGSGCHDSCDMMTKDNFDFFIIRFLQDGRPDTDFGDQALVKVDLGQNEFPSVMAVQDDGKIIVTGDIYYGLFSDMVLLRVLPNGKPDSTFGAAGIVITDLYSLNYPYSSGDLVALQPDGKIILIVKNYDQFGDAYPSAILRYDSNGILDPSFGNSGIIDSTYSSSNAIEIQYDGSILLAGGWCSWGCGMTLLQYTSSGHLDSTFSDHGQYASYGAKFSDVKVQKDHKILTTGYYPGNLFLMRFTPQGIPDTTFAAMGTSLTQYDDFSFSGNKIYLQPDGKIKMLGIANGNKVFVARFYNDINTSVEKVPLDRHSIFEVFPNPVAGNLNIAFSEIGEKAVITISDLSGKVIFKKTIPPLQNVVVNTDDFSTGCYFIQVLTEKTRQTKKIFISK